MSNLTTGSKFIINGIAGDNVVDLGVDRSTNTLQTIDYSHHEIHSGSTFRVQANADPVSSLVIAFKVGNQTKLPHIIWEVSHESSGYIQLLEGPTWTTNTGTDRAPKNSRRDSTNTSILEGDATGAFLADNIVIDPTGLAGGTVISDKRWYGTRESETTARRAELILKSNETYAFVWTSTDGAKGVQIRLEWYEHADKYA